MQIVVTGAVSVLGRRPAIIHMATVVSGRADPAIEAIVASWPGEGAAYDATGLGFTADHDFDGVTRDFIQESGAARPQ